MKTYTLTVQFTVTDNPTEDELDFSYGCKEFFEAGLAEFIAELLKREVTENEAYFMIQEGNIQVK